jgi:hypothetical protein
VAITRDVNLRVEPVASSLQTDPRDYFAGLCWLVKVAVIK